MRYIDPNELTKVAGGSLQKLDNRYDLYFFKEIKRALLENNSKRLKDIYFSDYLPGYEQTNETTLVSEPRRIQILEIMKEIYTSALRYRLTPESRAAIREILEAGNLPPKKTARFMSQEGYKDFTFDYEARKQKNREKMRKQRALIKGE